MEPTAQAPSPPPAPAAALSLLLSKKALDASRTEILVLASGILFLASQVCLLVWFFSGGPRGASAKKGQRKVSIVLPPETEPPSQVTLAAYDDGAKVTGSSNTDGNEESSLRLRRSSSWGGRSSHLGSLTRGRRKSAGSRLVAQDSGDDDDKEEAEGEKQGVKTSLSSPGPEPEPGPETDHVALAVFGDIGRMAAALAAPAPLPLPSAGAEIGGSGGGAEGMELREFDPRRAWGEAGLLGASIEKPRSPRSPRVLAADQAAMMDALCAEEGEKEDWKAAAPSPMGGLEGDPPTLASGFDDPLGVNRLVALPGEEEGPEGIELEARE